MPVPLHVVRVRSHCVSLVLLLVALGLPQLAGSSETALSLTIQTSHTQSTLLSIQFPTPQQGWAVGSGGTILKTTDSGKKWKRVVSGTTTLLTSVFFADSSNGWVTGAGGWLSRTTNGGESWSPQPVDTQQPLYAVYFATPDVGWVIGGRDHFSHQGWRLALERAGQWYHGGALCRTLP